MPVHNMAPKELLNCDDTELRTYVLNNSESTLDEMFRQIWQTVRAGRFYPGQPRNLQTAKAVDLGNVALRLATAASQDRLLREAWRILAHALTADEQFVAATDYYARLVPAFESLGDHSQAARMRLGYVAVLFYAGRYSEALAVAEPARHWFLENGDHLGYAKLCTNVANVYHRLDDHHLAYEYHSQAVQAFEKSGDRQSIAQSYVNLGNALASIDRFTESDAKYHAAERIGLELGLTDLWAQAAYNRAYLLFLRGRYTDALSIFQSMRKHFEQSGSMRHQALCDLDESEIYLQLNLSKDAIALGTQASQRFASMHMEYERGKSVAFVGVAHAQLRHLSSALQAFEESKTIFENEGNLFWTAMLDVYRSEVLISSNQPSEARTAATEALHVFENLNIASKQALCLELLGRVALALNDLAEAERLIAQLAAIMKNDIAPLRFSYLMLCGDVAARAGRNEQARLYYECAAEEMETVRSSLRHDDLRVRFLAGRDVVYERLMRLTLDENDAEKLKKAYLWCERAKSRGLVDLLSGHLDGVQSKLDESLQKKITDLREGLNVWYSRAGTAVPFSDLHTNEEVSAKENELTRLVREISQADPEYLSLQQTAGVSVEDVRSFLPTDTTLVEYFVSDGQVMAFVISDSTFRVFPALTPLTRISELQERLNFQLDKFLLGAQLPHKHASKILESTKHHLHELYTCVFEPLAGVVNTHKVVIVPHGSLHFIPFHALHDGQSYLIDRYVMSGAPSASVLKCCYEKNDVHEGAPLLIGVPDQTTEFILEEIEALHKLWPDSRVLIGERATCDLVVSEARRARFIHVATHGMFRHDNPMFSGLKLADGWLTALDLYSVRSESNLVTLSGCRSGLGGIAGGDDLLGLIRGFFYAGARSLLVSLWQVDDQSACALMERFYQQWQAGRSRAEALRNAMFAVREQWEHPVFWAPFQLLGRT